MTSGHRILNKWGFWGLTLTETGHLKRLLLLFPLKEFGPQGGGGALFFSSYVGSGPASTVYPQKYQEYHAPQKIFEIFATQKISRFCIFTLRIDSKIHRIIPKHSPMLG